MQLIYNKHDIDNKDIIFLTGLRRVGKTTLLKGVVNLLLHVKKIEPKHIFYISLDLYALEGLSIADIVTYIKSTTEDISSLVDNKDSKFYAISEKEIDEGKIDDGLWSQALVKAKGDENLRKIEYMKLRVKQLKKGK